MYWNKWTNVGTFESRTPLPKPARSLHKLHICRRKSGVDVAARRTSRSKFLAVYKRSDRVCPDLSCRCQQNRLATFTDYQRTHPIQVEYPGRGVCVASHLVENEQSGVTRIKRLDINWIYFRLSNMGTSLKILNLVKSFGNENCNGITRG